MAALDQLVEEPAQPAISPVVLRKAAKIKGEGARTAAEVFYLILIDGDLQEVARKVVEPQSDLAGDRRTGSREEPA